MHLIYTNILAVALISVSTIVLVDTTPPHYADSVGYKSLNIEDFPYIALVKLEKRYFLCSGTIVNDLFIVTSGTCTNFVSSDIENFSVSVGTTHVEEEGQSHDLEKCIVHKKVSDDPVNYNIGLLKLTKSLTFGLTVKAATLASKDLVLTDGMQFNVIGYEYDQDDIDLKQTKVSFVSNDDCQRLYNHWPSSVTITRREVCVLRTEDRGDFYGLGGSPLVQNSTVVGFLPFILQDCKIKPCIYLKISVYRSWIEEEIKQNS